MGFADSHRFSLIFIGFGGFEALEVRGPGATWGNLGRPGAPRHLSLFKEFAASFAASGWMLGHWMLGPLEASMIA